MTAHDAFMGVEPHVLVALGKVVVAAGRLEMVLAYIAKEIGVADPTGSASSVIKDVKKSLRGSFPLLVEPLPSEILDWLAQLPEPLERRHHAIHGVYMSSMGVAGDTSSISRLMRRSEQRPVRGEELEATAEQLAVLYTQGMYLFGSLRMSAESHPTGAAERLTE